ncbi:MAG: hypothetical protein K0S44_967 [Bacteroidetes bacterium]|nr:hypothetical protein [Bacteroidota bacterium]
MSQLQSLLQTLSDQELNELDSLRLIGKEKIVYDYTKKFRSVEFPDIPEVVKELGITEAHYYKINSILLRKAYNALIPQQGTDLLQFLKRKNVFNLLRHEIIVQDKKTSGLKNKKDLKAFYLLCFHYLIDLPYKYYDKKLIDVFGKKYLSVDKSRSDELYVKFHTLFADINRIAARKNPKRSLGITVSDLLKYEKELEGTDNHLALYYLYRCICSYYSYYDKQPKKVIEYLKKAMNIKEQIASFFPIDISLFLQLLYADALFTDNQIAEAEKIYNKAFEKGVDENMYGYYFHCEQYALVSILREKYEQAKELLDEVFQPCIDNRMDIYATRGALCYVKLYLSNTDLKNALNYLNIAKVNNEKTFYLPFDVQLRVLENIYFFMKKDYDFSFQLANRNIKFLKAQEQTDIFENYLLLWKMIIAMINSITRKTELSEEIIKDYEFLNVGYSNLYCGLLEKIYQQTIKELK